MFRLIKGNLSGIPYYCHRCSARCCHWEGNMAVFYSSRLGIFYIRFARALYEAIKEIFGRMRFVIYASFIVMQVLFINTLCKVCQELPFKRGHLVHDIIVQFRTLLSLTAFG